jgi:hypothetical protein
MKKQNYFIELSAHIESTLTAEQLKRLLVVALFDENEGMTPDNTTNELRVIDYLMMNVEKTAKT